MSRFIESIKIEDQKAFLLDLHQKRVNQTFTHFGKEGSIDLAKIFKNLEHDEDGLYKLRIVYDLDKKFTTQLIPYAIPEIENFQLVENNSYDYSFKFEDRKEFERMKTKAKTEEIIVVKKQSHYGYFLYQYSFFERQRMVYADNLSVKRCDASTFASRKENKRNRNYASKH